MKRIAPLAALLSLVLLAGCAGSATLAPEIGDVTPAQAAATIDQNAGGDFVILDIRTAEEYAGGKIAGALNIDFYAADFGVQLDRLDRDSRYLVYCRTGNRSSQAMPMFEELGFTKVDNLSGGLVAWYEQGYPVAP